MKVELEVQEDYGVAEGYYEAFEKVVDFIEMDFEDKFPYAKMKLHVQYNGVACVEAKGQINLFNMLSLINCNEKEQNRLRHYFQVTDGFYELSGSERKDYNFSSEIARNLSLLKGYKNVDFDLLRRFEEMTYEYMSSLMDVYKEDVVAAMKVRVSAL